MPDAELFLWFYEAFRASEREELHSFLFRQSPGAWRTHVEYEGLQQQVELILKRHLSESRHDDSDTRPPSLRDLLQRHAVITAHTLGGDERWQNPWLVADDQTRATDAYLVLVHVAERPNVAVLPWSTDRSATLRTPRHELTVPILPIVSELLFSVSRPDRSLLIETPLEIETSSKVPWAKVMQLLSQRPAGETSRSEPVTENAGDLLLYLADYLAEQATAQQHRLATAVKSYDSMLTEYGDWARNFLTSESETAS